MRSGPGRLMPPGLSLEPDSDPEEHITHSWEPGLPPRSWCGNCSPSSASTDGTGFSKDTPHAKNKNKTCSEASRKNRIVPSYCSRNSLQKCLQKQPSNVVPTYNRILVSPEKEGDSDTWHRWTSRTLCLVQ